MTSMVRKLDVADWEQLRDVRLRALQDAPESFYRSYAEESAYDEARWRDWLRDGHGLFVAERGGGPGGMIGGIPAGEDEGDPRAAMMVAMWVDPTARGVGVAEELTDTLVGWARAEGYPRLVLWVYDENPRAGAFYRRYGFLHTDRTETFGEVPRKLHGMTLDL